MPAVIAAPPGDAGKANKPIGFEKDGDNEEQRPRTTLLVRSSATDERPIAGVVRTLSMAPRKPRENKGTVILQARSR
jgi:hypothetical protein